MTFQHQFLARGELFRPDPTPANSFAHRLELRPARIGFNLELADPSKEEPERQKVWAGKAGLRRFRGRVRWEEEEGVRVLVGELPSGRVIDAVLPREWFEVAAVPVSPDQPFLLATWESGGGGREIWDERAQP